MSASAWHRWLHELAEFAGAVLRHTNGGHIAITHPAGWVVYCASTPSDHRALLNTRAAVKRRLRQVVIGVGGVA